MRDDADADLALLRRSPTLGPIAADDLAFLAGRAEVRTCGAGETVFDQGEAAEACFVIRSGAVSMSFTPEVAGEAPGATDAVSLRRYDDPGRLLGWSALVAPHRYRARVTAERPTSLMVLPRTLVEERMRMSPEFGPALLRRVISVLGHRLRETRIHMVARRYDEEVTAIRTLIDQSAERLHVDSPLHKIPFYLEHRLTVEDAFRTLELLRAGGDRHERDLAGLALDILGQVRRELTLYRDLQHVYETVGNAAPGTPPEEIRRRCCTEFADLFGKLDYVIRGEENLPREPGHVFIMNHLCNHPDDTLPNHFQLTLDTHFVSSMLLLEAYGEAPIRVIRRSGPDEFGHQMYYDRLGYIYVDAHHVDGPPEEVRAARHRDRQAFLDTARDHLRAGRNIVICPEGTSVPTRDSPVAFKAGAFRIAWGVEPEPLIVPVAVANFDRRVARTRLVACVHGPIRLSASVPREADDTALFAFIDECQRSHRQYVRDAVALAGEHEPS